MSNQIEIKVQFARNPSDPWPLLVLAFVECFLLGGRAVFLLEAYHANRPMGREWMQLAFTALMCALTIVLYFYIRQKNEWLRMSSTRIEASLQEEKVREFLKREANLGSDINRMFD